TLEHAGKDYVTPRRKRGGERGELRPIGRIGKWPGEHERRKIARGGSPELGVGLEQEIGALFRMKPSEKEPERAMHEFGERGMPGFDFRGGIAGWSRRAISDDVLTAGVRAETLAGE